MIMFGDMHMDDKQLRYHGLRRGPDGVIERIDGILCRSYENPGEAVIQWCGRGVKEFGCNHSTHLYSGGTGPCGKPAKHDPDHRGNLTKCGHHSNAAMEKKAAKRKAKSEAWMSRYDLEHQKRQMESESLEILRKIAAGHNDPRSVAQEFINRWDGNHNALNSIPNK